MSPETILYIIIAAILSLVLAVFMYGYKPKYNGNLKWIFALLRFLVLFGIGVLIINPKFKSETYISVKPKLSILTDNSQSIKELSKNKEVESALQNLKEDADLNAKFELAYYAFDTDVKQLDTLSFIAKNTNISGALSNINDVYRDVVAPVVLLTDGNQTLGSDYEFSGNAITQQIFPVAIGDSLQFTDLQIVQLNTNKYAFLKNNFPVEAIVAYSGKGTIDSQFVVYQGKNKVFSKNLSFSENNNTQTLSFTLPATAVGLQKYTASIIPLENEKNTTNNNTYFAVEVIDQSTNVLVVSNMIHPDLGALKKAITSNEQRKFLLVKPQEAISKINDSQLIILFQPDRSFSGVYTEINKLKKNTFVITGLQTDWNFLNTVQTNFEKEVTNQTEDPTANLNINYGTFAIEDIGFDKLPPLQTLFGELVVTIPHETILEQYIDDFSSESPMLATMEINGKRDAIWDGENIWKWRAQSYIKNNNFEEFDTFIGKMIQYLASNKRRSRLEVSSESFYYNNNAIKISAQYFDKNFVFDPRVSLNINVTNKATKKNNVYPMLLRNNFFEVDLSTLIPGEYTYTVTAQDQSVARSGVFTIIGYDVEKQFSNANVTKLRSLATNTGGALFMLNQLEALKQNLKKDNRYKTIQKSEIKTIPLIDWKYLLALIALLLSVEWFLRKYNGLI